MKYSFIATVGYVATILAANWATATFGLVPIGFGLAVTAGTFAAGAALILRDVVDERGGKILVALAIAVGIVLSYMLANPFIALASAVAFAGSELLDWAVFARVRTRSLSRAVFVSSVVSAPVDTVLFLAIAGFPLTLQAVAGQFMVKTVMALVAALAISRKR